MAYKNAVAGLDHGGGKAVIIGDPRRDKTPELLRAYGRFVESLSGRYVTAADVGTYVADMDVVSETTRFATGRSEANGGAGDSSVLTAYGVFQGMRAAAEHRWGSPSLSGRRVGISGVGKVGPPAGRAAARRRRVRGRLRRERGRGRGGAGRAPVRRGGRRRGDPDRAPARRVLTERHGSRAGRRHDRAAPGRDRLRRGQQPARRSRGRAVRRTGSPSAGSSTRPTSWSTAAASSRWRTSSHGFDFERARARTAGIYDTTLAVLRESAERGTTPSEAANHLAEERMAAASPGGVWLPAGR